MSIYIGQRLGSAGASGDVVGPASSVDNEMVTFDGTSGKLIQGGGLTLESAASFKTITEPVGGTLMRWFTNGNTTLAMADDATFAVQGDLDPSSFSRSLATVTARAEPSSNTGNILSAMSLNISRTTDNNLGAMYAFQGATADSRSTGTVANGSPLSFSVNVTGGATHTRVFANDVNINAVNGSEITVAGGVSLELQGSSGDIPEVRLVDFDNNRTGTTGEVSLIYARSNATPTSQYVVNVDGNFEGNNNLVATDGTDDKYIPWSSFNDGQPEARITTVNAASYTALLTDHILHVTYTSTGSCTINLPAASTATNKRYVIKDASGNAFANNITVDANASETIDGSTTAILSADYISITIYSDGSNWFII